MGSANVSPELQALCLRLGHVFDKPELLIQALTHRSFGALHNERLEFLGDSVLNMAVADMLYQRLKRVDEGDLSRTRANLVRQDSLHAIALDLQLSAVLRLGAGELQSGGRERPSILADAMEAILGAIYLDTGYDKARDVIWRLLAHIPLEANTPAAQKDAKTALQEHLQSKKWALPKYSVVGSSGAAHEQTFHVRCELEKPNISAEGRGKSRRLAEQMAAQTLLNTLLKR
jgi:ribonuclease III